MNFYYETDRLILKVLTGRSAADVLRFYLANRAVFEQYETSHPKNFYTLPYQHNVLNSEYNLCIRQTGVRFWIYEKTDPSHIIGTVCLRGILRQAYQRCEIGYKFDRQFWHHGYACEALCKCVEIAFYEMRLHKIIAYIMPGNAASIRLAERAGFEREGIARKHAKICGVWTDHAVYSIIRP